MNVREHVANALIREGLGTEAADVVVPAMEHWLHCRVSELQAEGKYADATWYNRVANEVRAAWRTSRTRACLGTKSTARAGRALSMWLHVRAVAGRNRTLRTTSSCVSTRGVMYGVPKSGRPASLIDLFAS